MNVCSVQREFKGKGTAVARSPETNELLRAATRDAILAHALRLFARHGYDRTSIRMLAASAGIATGLVYSHFASKDDLLRAIFDESVRDVEASFAAAGAAPPERRIEALVRAAFDGVRRHEEFWRLSYGVRMQSAVLAGLGDTFQQWASRIRATLEGYFRESGVDDPALDAAVLFATIDGVAQHYVLDPDRYPLDAVAARVIARFGSIGERRSRSRPPAPGDAVRPRPRGS